MSEETGTQVESAEASGTTQTGQPSTETNVSQGSESKGQFDAISAQADYSRKTQELAEQRKAFEKERADFQARLAGLNRMQQGPVDRGYGNSVSPDSYAQQKPYPYQGDNGFSQTEQQQRALFEGLADEFGVEGAKKMFALVQQQTQQVQQQAYQMQYNAKYQSEYEKAIGRFGDKVKQFDYTNPYTGSFAGNQIIDAIAKGFTLEQAWAAFNASDPTKLEQEMRDKVSAELSQKSVNTPHSSQAQPQATGSGHAKSIREAWEQAEKQHGMFTS